MNMDVLTNPLTKNQMAFMSLQNEGWIKGNVLVSLNELIDHNFESFLDHISELLTGTDILQDISYTLVGFLNGDCVIEVQGDPTAILDEFPYNLSNGDEVTWNDPDNGLCSVTGNVEDITWINEDAVHLTLNNGWSSEVLLSELS